MTASNRRDLFISVSGSVTGLAATMKSGRSLLNEFGSDSVNVLELVEQKLGQVGAGGLPGLKQAEQNFDNTFRRIRENARSVLDAPSGQAAIQIVDANATLQAASAAEQKAAAYRLVAEAATRADQAQSGQNAAVRAYAVAAAAAAVEAEGESRALREQAGILAQVDGQLDKSTASQRRQVAINGQTRAGYQQLSFQLGDVATQYAAGTSASIIFAQQSGQVIQAIQLIAGEAKGIIGFLGGPWGVAISAALVALTPFVGKILEGGNALAKESDHLKENAEKAAIADQAKQAFLRTEAGAIDDVRALTEELKKQNEALATNAERQNIRSKRRLEALTDRRSDVADELTTKRKELVGLSSGAAGSDASLNDARRSTREAIAALEATLPRVDREIVKANAARLETQKDLAQEAAGRANDPIAAIKYKYEGQNGLIEQTKARATAEETINGTLTRRLQLLDAEQKKKTAEAQAAQTAARRTGNNNQVGNTVDVAGATQIIESIGGRVTSGFRTRAKQEQLFADKLAGRHNGPVARPGTSDHERGQAVDVAYGRGISEATIKAAFAKAGVSIRQPKDEPGQRVFHVAFGPKGKSQESVDRSAETQRQKQIRDEEAYAALKTRAQQDLLDTTRGQVTSVADAADIDAQAVVLARQRLDEAADAGVLQKRWTQAQADQLKAIYTSTAGLKVQAIREREADELARRKLDVQRDDTDAAIGLLQQQGELATTAGDRRRVALEILALEERIARATLETAIAAEKDPERKAGLQRRLGEVPTVFAGRREAAERQTDDPLQAYGRQLIDRTSNMNTALKKVKVDGLRELEDGLVGVISGTENVASAFKRMAASIIQDLARIAIEKAIVAAVGKSFFGFADGGKIADAPGYANGGIPFVDQGLIRGPGDGRSDSILALVDGRKPIRVSNGEAIVNERGVRKHWALIDAINKDRLPAFADGGLVSGLPRLPNVTAAAAKVYAAQAQRLQLQASVDVQASPLLMARVQETSVRTVSAAAEPIMAGAEGRTMRRIRRASLPGAPG